MKVINHTDLRLNLKKWLDIVVDDMEELIVTRKINKDMLSKSLKEYNSLKETKYLLSGKNRGILLNSIDEARKGNVNQNGLME